jgi:hypothetical protein
MKTATKSRPRKTLTETERFVKENRRQGAKCFDDAFAEAIEQFPGDSDLAFDHARIYLAVTITRIICDPKCGWNADEIDSIRAADDIIETHLKSVKPKKPTAAEFAATQFGLLTNYAWFQTHPWWERDGFSHTSDVCRAIAVKITDFVASLPEAKPVKKP